MQDQAATLALLHRGKPAGAVVRRLAGADALRPGAGPLDHAVGLLQRSARRRLRLGRLGRRVPRRLPGRAHARRAAARNLGGRSRAPAPDATPPAAPTSAPAPLDRRVHPVSGFARHARARRRLDTAWTLAAFYRGLGGTLAGAEGEPFETPPGATWKTAWRAKPSRPPRSWRRRRTRRRSSWRAGWSRRGAAGRARLPGAQPVQLQPPRRPGTGRRAGGRCRSPGRSRRARSTATRRGWSSKCRRWASPGCRRRRRGRPPPAARMRLADDRCVRNEFFEAEIDPADRRPARHPRPAHARQPAGPAARLQPRQHGPRQGDPHDLDRPGPGRDHHRGRCSWTPRSRCWPPSASASGPGWAGRCWTCASRSRRCSRRRAIPGTPTTGPLRLARRAAAAAARRRRHGLRHQPHAAGDARLPGAAPGPAEHGHLPRRPAVPPAPRRPHARRDPDRRRARQRQAFDLAIGLDREYPMQTALGLVTPVPVVATAQGPPHVGADRLAVPPRRAEPAADRAAAGPGRRGRRDRPAAGMHRAAYFAELRCVRDPRRAVLLDARGNAADRRRHPGRRRAVRRGPQRPAAAARRVQLTRFHGTRRDIAFQVYLLRKTPFTLNPGAFRPALPPLSEVTRSRLEPFPRKFISGAVGGRKGPSNPFLSRSRHLFPWPPSLSAGILSHAPQRAPRS